MSAVTDLPARRLPGGSLRGRLQDASRRHRSWSVVIGMGLVTALLPVIVLLPPFNALLPSQAAWVDSFALAGIYVLLALGLNIVVGLAGLLDLGYAAFFAIGAYTYAYAASPFGNEILGIDLIGTLGQSVGLIFWPMLLVGALVAAIFGILLGAPTLRLRGDYLAIVTLGFGEIVPITFQNAQDLTNGNNGIAGIAKPSLPGLDFTLTNPWPYYLTMAALITIVMVFCYRLVESRLGRAWEAIREDELAAASNGINTVTTKLLAFALGASTAGFAGVFSASKLTLVSPDQFLFVVSFTVLAMVVLGGMGNIWGVAVGAFIIYGIQNVLLKQLNVFFDNFPVPILSEIDFIKLQFLLYGIALVAMMLLRPGGLFPNRRRQRELTTAMTEPGEDELGVAPEEFEETIR